MKKVVSVLIMLALACNVFSVVSFAEIDFSGGLLDRKPFKGGIYQVTDNNLSTYYGISAGYISYTFEKPANIIGYRVIADTDLRIEFLIGEDRSESKLYNITKINGEFVSREVNNVKEIRLRNFGYTVRVYEFNVYGTIVEPVPTQVKNVYIKNMTSTNAIISWTPNPEAEKVTKYIIYLNGEKYGETTGTEYTINNLQPNTFYEVTVTAVNEAGEGPPSEPCIFTTPEPPPEPSAQVKNVVIKNMTSTSATISWTPNPEAEKITKYIIYLNGEKYGETEDTKYVIDGLKEGEKYTVTVAAVNALGEGPPSAPITFVPLKIVDISSTIKIQDILSSIAILFTNLWPLIAFIVAVIAIVPITAALKQTITRRRSNA